MIAMKLGWAAAECLCLWLTLAQGSAGALALGAVLLLLPVLSLPGNLLLRKRLRLRVETPAALRKADQGTALLCLDNPTLLPALRVRCRVTIENLLNGERRTRNVLTWAFPRKSRQVRIFLGSEYCGRLRISVEKVRLYDCFGLFGVPCAGGAVGYVTVQPDTFGMTVRLLPNPDSPEDSDSYSQERPGADMTETFQIREYVPGDSLRQIHWKLSGKFDRLVVRDPALPITRDVLVFWERTVPSDTPALIDAQAETVVTLCRTLLDGGIPFTLGWNDPEKNRCVLHEIGGLEELVGVVPKLLSAAGGQGEMSGAALLAQTRPEALCAHMVYIARENGMDLRQTGHVTALLCGDAPGENGIFFDGKNYRQQLAEIDV